MTDVLHEALRLLAYLTGIATGAAVIAFGLYAGAKAAAWFFGPFKVKSQVRSKPSDNDG